MIFSRYSSQKIKDNLHMKETEVIVFDRIDSTNNYLKEIAECGKTTLVVADEQSGGRGRGNRSFYSPADTGIYMSLSFKIPCDDYPIYAVTPFSSVAVMDSLENETGIACKVKWVNDIYHNDKKICGILTEKIGSRIIIGIGINLVSPRDGFPESAGLAGALLDGEDIDTELRNRLVSGISNQLFSLLKKPDSAFLESLREKYSERLILKGKEVYISSGADCSDYWKAIILGIDSKFRLQVKNEEGHELFLDSGEVHIIKNNVYK